MNNEIIIDLGANHGGFSLEISKRNPDITVYAIEADNVLYHELKEKSLMQNLKNHIPLNFAIAEKNGTADFYKSELGDQGTSSLFEFNKKNISQNEYWAQRNDLKHSTKTTVETKTLESFLDTIEFTEISFLKIDIQGMDLVALRTTGKHLNKIQAGMLEVPTIADNSLHEVENSELRDALNFLFENNMKVYAIKPNDEANNETNVFFHRKDIDINKLEKNIHLKNFHFYDGKNYWHAPSHKLEFPEQHILNLEFVLNQERESLNKIKEENKVLANNLELIKNNIFFKILNKFKCI